MFYKNCALVKKSLSAVALLGAVLNTSVFGMDQNRQDAQRNQKTNLALVPADVWAQSDSILEVKNIKGRNTIEKVLLLKETIRKPHQYDLKDKGEDFSEQLVIEAKKFGIFIGINVNFGKGATKGGYCDAIRLLKSSEKLNTFVNLKCENWPGSCIRLLLENENATQIVNLDLTSNKSACGWPISSYCSTMDDLGEALSKSNLTNLKVLNLAGLSFYVKENPFSRADRNTQFVSYLHLDKKMPKLEVLDLKDVEIDRRDKHYWDSETKRDLEEIERTPRPALGRFSRMRILK